METNQTVPHRSKFWVSSKMRTDLFRWGLPVMMMALSTRITAQDPMEKEIHQKEPQKAQKLPRVQVSEDLVKNFANRLNKSREIPPSLIARRKENLESVDDLSSFEPVSDVHSTIDTVFFQVSDGMGIDGLKVALQLRPSIKVIVVAAGKFAAEKAYFRLKNMNLENFDRRVKFIVLSSPVTDWGRDPYTVLVDPKTRAVTLLPSQTNHHEGDLQVAPALTSHQLGFNLIGNEYKGLLSIQGGDLRADSGAIYTSQASIHDSTFDWTTSQKKRSEDDALKEFQSFYKNRKIVVFGDNKKYPPDSHIDRYFAPLGQDASGQRIAVLGDPVKTFQILQTLAQNEKDVAIKQIEHELGKQVTEGTIRSFFNVTPNRIELAKTSTFVKYLDSVEAQLKSEGIEVRRIPMMPKGFDGESFLGLYYPNVILDEFTQDGKRIKSLIMPSYHIPALDNHVRGIYSSLGFDVKPISLVQQGFNEGGARCLIQAVAFPAK